MANAASMSGLLALIEHITPEGGEWCKPEEAAQLASLVLAFRPRTIVEIGVFLGGALVPMALAQASYAVPAREVCWAVDPWAADASVAGQTDTNAKWWGKLDYDMIYRRFVQRLERYELGNLVMIARTTSDAFNAPNTIDLLRIDGNHGEQARRDIERLVPRVPIGGIAVLDDVDWEGGHVRQGYEFARAIGFVELYSLGSGVVMQRRLTPVPAPMVH